MTFIPYEMLIIRYCSHLSSLILFHFGSLINWSSMSFPSWNYSYYNKPKYRPNNAGECIVASMYLPPELGRFHIRNRLIWMRPIGTQIWYSRHADEKTLSSFRDVSKWYLSCVVFIFLKLQIVGRLIRSNDTLLNIRFHSSTSVASEKRRVCWMKMQLHAAGMLSALLRPFFPSHICRLRPSGS